MSRDRTTLGRRVDAQRAAVSTEQHVRDTAGPDVPVPHGTVPVYGPNGEPLNRAARRGMKRRGLHA